MAHTIRSGSSNDRKLISLNTSVTFYTVSEVKAKNKQLKKEIKVEVDVIERDKRSYKLFFSPPESPWAYNRTKQKEATQMGEKSEMTGGDGSAATGDGEWFKNISPWVPFTSFLIITSVPPLWCPPPICTHSIRLCVFLFFPHYSPLRAPTHRHIPPQEAACSCLPVLKVEWKC